MPNSIKYTFQEIQRLNPIWSSWVCFCEMLNKLKIKDRMTIWRWFNRLVNKNNYTKKEKRQLIDYLSTPDFQK